MGEHSIKAWWLAVAVPAWLIAINPLVGLVALAILVVALLCE